MAVIKSFRIKSFKKNIQIANFKNVTLSYGKRKILDNINFDIYPGEILGLLGPNGVGKSTLFNLLIGLIKPDSGQIFINSTNVNDFPIYLRTRKFNIGYVPQYGGYFHDLTLIENFNAISEIVIEDKRKRPSIIKDLIYKMIINSGLTIKNKDNLEGDIEIKIIGLRPGEKLYEELLIGANPQKTSHDKIQKAQDSYTPFNKLNEDLNILKNLLKENNVNAIKDMLKKLVSTYKSETKIVDHLFSQQSNLKIKK